MGKRINIPAAFYHPLFFAETRMEVYENQSFEETLKRTVFLYDILHSAGEYTPKPWEDQEKFIPKIFEYWAAEKKVIGELFRQRKRNDALPPMTAALGHFISALFWTNGLPVEGFEFLTEKIDKLKYKPINLEERLQFLMKGPNHHHSYIQLGELYTELTKLYYKMLALNRK